MSNGTNTTIETVTGQLVDLATPKPTDFKAIDVAWSLSREPRFGGHTVTALPYTVGQHSIQVANLIRDALNPKHKLAEVLEAHFVEDQDILAFIRQCGSNMILRMLVVKLGLLHDASEAYLRDLPSPVKNLPGLKEAYLSAEKAVMIAILASDEMNVQFDSIGESTRAWKIVHWADIFARTIEAYHFMPSRGAFWPVGARFENVTLNDLQNFELPRPAIAIFDDFLAYLSELSA